MAGVAAAPVTVGGVAALVDWRSALLVAAVGGLAVVAAFQLLFTEPDSTTASASAVGESDATATDGASGPSPGLVARARGRLSALLRFRITPSVVVLTVLTLCVSLQLRALHAFATGFLVDGVGQSASRANGLFFLMLAASAVASIWIGGLADRVDRRLLGTAAAGVTTLVLAAMVLLPGVDGATGPGVTALLAGAFAVLGFAVYGCTPVKNALVSEHATEGASGSLFGVMQTTSAVGSAAGPALFGLVATEAGVGVAFPAVAAVGVLVVGCFLALGRVE
jgi:MFS family permease